MYVNVCMYVCTTEWATAARAITHARAVQHWHRLTAFVKTSQHFERSCNSVKK